MAEETKIYVKKKKPMFQRTKFRAYVKLGKGQKSKQKYRKATGRHNKTRQQWKSRPPRVEVGYKNKVDQRGLIEGKVPVVILNLAGLKALQKNQVAIMGNIGDKKKMEIAKEAEKNNIEILNLNIKKFMRNIERAIKHKQKVKDERKSKKVKAEKKVKKAASKDIPSEEGNESKNKEEAKVDEAKTESAPKEKPSEEMKK